MNTPVSKGYLNFGIDVVPRRTKMGIEEHYLKKIESWFIMLNTPENDNYDSGMVRDEMKEFLVSEYKNKIGAS